MASRCVQCTHLRGVLNMAQYELRCDGKIVLEFCRSFATWFRCKECLV